jgi:hypothetical protein
MIHPWTHDCVQASPSTGPIHVGKRLTPAPQPHVHIHRRRTFSESQGRSNPLLLGGGTGGGVGESPVPSLGSATSAGDRSPSTQDHRLGKRFVRSASMSSVGSLMSWPVKDSPSEPNSQRPASAAAIQRRQNPHTPRDSGIFLSFPKDGGDASNSAAAGEPTKHTGKRRAQTPPDNARGRTYDISTDLKSKKRITPPFAKQPGAVPPSPRPVFQRNEEPEVVASLLAARPLVKRTVKQSKPSSRDDQPPREAGATSEKVNAAPKDGLGVAWKHRAPEKKMFPHPDNHVIGGPEACTATPMIVEKEKHRGVKHLEPPQPIHGDREYVPPRGVKHLAVPTREEKKTGIKIRSASSRGSSLEPAAAN